MRIKVKGIQINYELSGKAGAAVVMLSHSLGSSLVMWEPQMRAIEPHYRVLRYDTRGHGSTDGPTGPYTLEQLGEDAIGLVDALSIDVVHWVGLSLGGMVGQYLALNQPHRLRGLVLCDTAAIMPKEGQAMRQERIETARNKGMQALLQPTLERWFTPPFLKQNSQEVTLIRNQFLATPVEGYIGCIEAIKGLNYLDRLREIKTPTLIIVGEDDLGTPVTTSKAMQKRIPDSKLVVLPAAAHLSNVEQADAFNSTIPDFLKEH